MAMAILTKINFHNGKDSGCFLMILLRLFYITVVPALLIILHGQLCNAQQPNMICNGAQYTNGSQFERNLKTVLNNLVQNTSQTGFNTSVYGQGSDQIFGLLQCRGDTTVDECYNCSQLVTTNIKKNCGNGIGGRVWFDLCYLRYENYSFIGDMVDSGGYFNTKANVTNPSVFIPALQKLLSKLVPEAATAMKRCAFGMNEDSLFRKIYGQAECTRDISADNCTKCLSNTINNIFAIYPGMVGLEGLMGSCIVRYDINSFFNLAALPPAPAPAEPPTKQITPLSKNNSPQIDYSIILIVLGGFLLVL